MNWISQVIAITSLNIRNLSQRIGSSAVAVFGIAGVVAVFIAVLSIAAGFQKTMTGAGSPDTAMVMRAGADTEMSSILPGDEVKIAIDTPGIMRNAAGPVASAELFVIVDAPKKTTGTAANVPLRGVPPAAFALRPEVKLIEGRMFEWGRNEVIAGKAASSQFDGLYVGSVLKWGQNTWKVVGLFESGGTLPESELWTDVNVLAPAYRRANTFQAVYAKLTSADAFTAFKDKLTTDPRLNVQVRRESDYYAEQSRVMSALVTRLGVVIAGLMGIGAVFGALNTMYTAVSSRTREIATLRALGFSGGPVVISVMAEALLLAVLGGAIGSLLAYAAFNGYQTSTMNWQSFSQVSFAFAVTPSLLVQGIVYSVLMGLVGGLFPAVRAARLPIVTALREL